MTAYSILVHEPIKYDHQLYLATAEDFSGDFLFNVALTSGEHPESPLPALPLRLDARGPRLDYIKILNLWANLCSIRFIEVLQSKGVTSISYPAQVKDISTGEPLPGQYFVWKPVTIRDAIDWERCKYAIHPVFHRKELSEIVLTDACLQAAPLLFYDPKYSEWLIRNDVGEFLARAGITGMQFYPLTLPLYQRMQPGRLIAGASSPQFASE